MSHRANNSFDYLLAFLRDRFMIPLGHVSFWTYFILAIIGLGAVGVWVELFRWMLTAESGTEGMLTAIYTYFPAVAAGATLQLVMASDDKHVRSFSMLLAFVIGATVVPHALGLVKVVGSFLWGLVGTVFSLGLWWIANGANQDFLDLTPVDSLGGDSSMEPKGNIGDFNV